MSLLDQRRNRFSQLQEEFQPDLYHNLFFQQVKDRPEAGYVYSNYKSLTYAETSDAVKALAASLINHGLGANNQHVTVIFPNYAELVISKLATSLLGQVAVPLNYRLNTEEMGYLINQSDSNYIITIDKWRNMNYIEMFQELFPEVFQGKKSPHFPNLEKIVVFSPEGHLYEGTLDFYSLIQSENSVEADKIVADLLENQVGDVHTLSDIMYTSGTTSKPKGVLVTHDMIYRAAMGSCINRGYEHGRKIFIPIPLYHCFGYIIGLVAATIVGGSVILQDDFDEEEAMQLIRDFKADDMLCVPTIALRLVKVYKEQENELSLRAMYCAGAEVPITLWEDLKNNLKIEELITGYGMTELASGVLQTNPHDEIHFLVNFVGKTIPGGHLGLEELNGNNIEFKIRDIDTREFLPYGREGELVCRGPLVTKGYYNKPQETEDSFMDGWLNTGDLAVMHENGYVALTGRLKEIYRIGAENVAPKEIEEILTAHEAISQAYVVGIPDVMMGEVGLAWVVLKERAVITEEEIFNYLSKKLARYKIPKYIKFIEDEDLPKTATGKIQKFRLKELFETNA